MSRQKEDKTAAGAAEETNLRESVVNTPVQTAFEEEHLIYIGPTLPIGLSRYMTYRGGKPAHIVDYLKSVPAADALFIPVAEFATRQREVSDPGKPLYAAYIAVEAHLKGGA
ncbi:hypothetical protein [Paenibacillus sp. GbtcB18]|uniref:hypothetical protein n=1 Tax=Paenibacillus sp. GbtcB18 TaxID=2824763 RepID=UPI001C2FAAD9|nr:hypothetical protein [Paenibacillus sp. GbtcB18]